MVRMRSISDTARYFKEMDPNTQFSEYTLRRLIAAGQITTIRVGTKYLINLDKLLESLEEVGVYTPVSG